MSLFAVIVIVVVVFMIANNSTQKSKQSTSNSSKSVNPSSARELEARRQAFAAERKEAAAKHRQDLDDQVTAAASANFDAVALARREKRLVVDANSAEKAMEIAMGRYLGIKDARCTAPGPDGGIDIQSGRALAQVKYFPSGAKVGRPDVQRLIGAAYQARRKNKSTLVLFFAFGTTPFSGVAIEEANNTNVALFSFNEAGEIFPANTHAVSLPLADSDAQARAHALWTAKENLNSAKPSSGRSGSRCKCGGNLVSRRRHSDGKRFLGCSEYPRCTETKAIGR